MSAFQRKVTFTCPDGTQIEQAHHGPGARLPTDLEMQAHTPALVSIQPSDQWASITVKVDDVDVVDPTEKTKWTGIA